MTFEDHAAAVRLMQDQLSRLGAQALAIGQEIQNDVFPEATRLFAGTSNAEAVQLLEALGKVGDSAMSFTSDILDAETAMTSYLYSL